MQRAVLLAAMFGMLFAITACDTFSTEPGSFVVLFQWETGHEPDTAAKDYYMWAYYQEWKGGEGKTFPADIESNAKSLDEAGPVKLGSGESLNFTKLTYGDNRFVRAAIWDNADRTGDPLYVGVSELFDFSASDRNKTVAVNMKLQANAGVDETGQAGSFAIEVRYDGVAVDRVPSATVTLRLTVKNADTVIIANDLNFEKGVIEKKLTELTKIDETTYELAAWDITEGWTDLGDALYSVFGKSRNQLGYESVPKRAEVYLDTTAPFLTVKTDALAYNASGMVTITVSSNETLKEPPLIGIYDADEALVKDISADVEELQAGTSYRYQIPVIGTLDDGDYHIVASAADLIDNATADIASDPFAVDSLAPELDGDPVITPDRIAAEQNYTVTFTAQEEMSGGLVTVQRKEETLTCTNTGLDYTCTGTSPAGEGDSIDPVTITLTDAAGNIGSFNAGTLYIDRTSPTLTAQIVPGDKTLNASELLQITINASEELNGVPIVQLLDSADNPISPTNTENQGLSFVYSYPILIDGTYHIIVDAADMVGHNADTIEIADIRSDSSIPAVSGTAGVTPDRIKPGDDATITFTVTEPMNDTGDSVEVKVGDTATVCTTTNGTAYTCTYTASGTGADSIETISIALTDASANGTTASAGMIYVDRTAPTLTLDLNKDAFNANDTIRITVTASEELDGLPVTTIPKASMTLAAPTQISSFSWLYTVDPTLFADDDYTVNTEGDDLVAQNGADSADFSVDSSVPDLVTGTVDRAKAGIGIAYTVDFETTEPVIGTGGVPAVKANEIPLSCVKNGSDTIFRCARTVGAEETDSTVYGITATLTDAAGNNRIVTIGSVMADKVLPNTVSGTTVLSIDAGVDCGLTQEQVTTIADGATAYLSVQVSEKLAVGYTPTLTATKTDAPDRVFDLDTQNGLTYYFSYLYSESAPTTDMIGEYTLELSLKDEAGNETMVTVMPDKPFKTAWNTPVLVIDQNAVSYNRSPWGRPTDTELKDGLGATVYTVPADEYYELGPNDIYEATDRLSTGTFTLNYGTATGTPVQLKAWDKEGAELRMEHSRPNGDGTWSRGRVWAYNTPKVLVSAVDSSCHETVPVKIQNANWLATMNRKEPGDYYKNPHTFLSNGLINQILEQDLKSLQEPLNGGISLIQQQGKSSWVPWDENDDQPAARHDHAMTYDSTRGKVVLFGGSSGGSETWEWDGANWTQKNPATRPPTRSGHAVAYDSARGKVVLFGGDNGTVSNNETWEWDGTNWTQMNPVTKPSVRSAHAMTYDSVRGKVVLFGGYLSNNQTWEWDGTNWTLMNPATRPSARYGHAMAYDSARRKVVLFGGNQGSSETWEWDGTNWTQMNPVTKPSGRSYHEMAYDSVHGKVFLFGGLIGASTYNNETWEWNGTNWIQMTPGAKPSTRYNHAMAYDSARGKTVIFGGYTSSAANDETWEWDGTNWTRMNLAARPSGRIYHAMTYDSTRKKAVLFGGSNGVAGTGSETWEWDGANWTQMNPATKPTTRYSHAMAYDSTRGKVLLFGGTNGGNETWEWDGANWTQMSPVAKPSTRYGHAMAYDSVRGKVVLFGGTNGTVRNDETWEWDGTNWTQMSPVAKPSTRYAHAMAYDSLRGKVVLFGGHIGSGQSDETWEWNGTNWTQMNPTAKPSTREYPSMTYDSAHGKVILFGGLAVTAGNDETWEWDGTNWIQMNLATKPSGRYGYAMTYDSFRAKVVLFGGDTSSGYNNETWLWDGNNNDRAGQIMNVSWESSGITDDNSIQSVSVFFNAGGLGDITGTPTSGVDLLAWKHDRWETVASNEADPENLAPVTWETTDPVEIQTLLNSGLRKFNFAVVPTAPNGFLTDMGSIATDYAEVIVRYSAP